MSAPRIARRSRWQFFTKERGHDGSRGPWGPIEASSEADAFSIARARCASLGMTLSQLQPLPPSYEEAAEQMLAAGYSAANVETLIERKLARERRMRRDGYRP